jgi:hypothetical protein
VVSAVAGAGNSTSKATASPSPTQPDGARTTRTRSTATLNAACVSMPPTSPSWPAAFSYSLHAPWSQSAGVAGSLSSASPVMSSVPTSRR